GLTGGLMMPLLGGVPVYLYPSPLHYRIVPELLYDTCATILFGTDTFLRGYARTAHPYDLRTVRLIVAGAEAVKESTRQTYMDRAKRFAKIGGEMVSLAAVEALAAEACPGAALVVVSLPDARKGEQLVLITTDPALKRDVLVRHARARGAAELMVPAEILLVA